VKPVSTPGRIEVATRAEQPRGTGVYLCRCGPNLGALVALDAVADAAGKAGAADVAVHDLLCAPEGRAWLAARLRERGVSRAVVAACSPREHERTFQGVLADAGLASHALAMVNLREQVEWVGGDARTATERARRLVVAGLARAALQRAIPAADVPVAADVRVVGGGVAGVSAALALAQRDRRVFLVERAFALGGLANRLDQLAPDLACASCFLEPVLDRVLHSERIEVLTGAEVRRVRGAAGRFAVELAVRPRHVDPALCLGCADACASRCPVELPDPAGGPGARRRAIDLAYAGCLPHVAAVERERCRPGCDACVSACGFGAVRLDEAPSRREVEVGAIVIATGLAPGEVDGPDGVVSSYGLERMLHPDGPTKGEVRGAGGGAPRLAVLATDAAEEDGPLATEEVLKLAHRLRAALPAARVLVLGGVARAPQLARRAAALRDERVELLDEALVPLSAAPGPDGIALRVRGDAGERTMGADLLVLHRASRAQDGAAELARALRLAVDARGFVAEASPFEPTSTRIAGVHVVGAAAGPRTVREAIRDGVAAAGLVLSTLVPSERRALEPLAAEIDAAICGGCGICVASCAFGAVALGPDGKARVEPAYCRGCGICTAGCPTGAAEARHFTRAQLRAELSALLAGRPAAERP